MATKIRLQRHGKKRYAYYHIVVADSRAKRDGKNIERLGAYNPNTNPATIELDFERTLQWVKTGAQPTDTARAILSYKGVMMKNHLDKGVLKGAFSQEEADKRFEKWLAEKEGKIQSKAEGIEKAKAEAAAKALADEKAKTEAKLAEAAAAEAAAEAEAQAAEETANAPEGEATEEPAAEATETATEEAPVEEAPTAESKEEATEKEAPKAEATEEAPKAEAEEAPAEEAEETKE
jgi:small subunit ribosomal protein S16